MFWLVARALFRASGAIEKPQIAFAVSIAVLVVAASLLRFAHAQSWLDATPFKTSLSAIQALLGLLGPGVLVLTCYEGLRDFHSLPDSERRLRTRFVGVFASCVLLTSVLPSLWLDSIQRVGVERLLVGISACSAILVGAFLVATRRKNPLVPAAQETVKLLAPDVAAPITPELQQLALQIEHAMHAQALYLDPELKVSALAQALEAPEYKITRALTGALGQKNFNQYVNHFRVQRAQQLLAEPSAHRAQILEIALRSGFASLGPFNRAFKAQCGFTPSEYRARQDKPVSKPALQAIQLSKMTAT